MVRPTTQKIPREFGTPPPAKLWGWVGLGSGRVRVGSGSGRGQGRGGVRSWTTFQGGVGSNDIIETVTCTICFLIHATDSIREFGMCGPELGLLRKQTCDLEDLHSL